MSYRAAAIANELLDLAARDNRKLTQIEIQKLVYFSHGWHLALVGQNLIEEQIEAWKYGPVVRSLYDAFKKFGSSEITEKAVYWKISNSRLVPSWYPTIQSASVEDDACARAVVQSVWKKYGLIPPFKLVEITHLNGSPWQKSQERGDTYIPNEEIKEYFERVAARGFEG